MSVRTMARVWDLSRHSGSDLLMLLAIADFSDDSGNAYPAVPTLAEKCRMSPRNANLILANLKKSGELIVKQNEGPKGTNRYLIRLQTPEARFTPEESFTLKPTSPTPEAGFPKPLKPASDEPSVNHQEPSECAQAPSLDARKAKSSFITLAQFVERCKASGEKTIPADDPIWEYAHKVGITTEMIAVAWLEFKAAYLSSAKRYKDWRHTFRNAVRRNWYKLWFLADGQEATWTTAGEQARRAAA